MVRHGQATGKPCVSSAAFQQPANFNVVLVKKTEMVGSDARSMGMASPGSAPGYGKVLEGL